MDLNANAKRPCLQIATDALGLIFKNTFSRTALGSLIALSLLISFVGVWSGEQKGLPISLALTHGFLLPMFLCFGGYRQNDPAWGWWMNRGVLSPRSIMLLQLTNLAACSVLCTFCLVFVYLFASLILQKPWEIALPFSLVKAPAASCIPLFIGIFVSVMNERPDRFRNATLSVIVLLPVLHSLSEGSDFQNACRIFPNLLVNYKEQSDLIYAWFGGSAMVAYLSSFKIR